MANKAPIESFVRVAQYCAKTKCYNCPAGVEVQPDPSRIDDTHYRCGLVGSEPRNWNIQAMEYEMKEKTIQGLQILLKRADLDDDEVNDIDNAISFLKESNQRQKK